VRVIESSVSNVEFVQVFEASSRHKSISTTARGNQWTSRIATNLELNERQVILDTRNIHENYKRPKEGVPLGLYDTLKSDSGYRTKGGLEKASCDGQRQRKSYGRFNTSSSLLHS